MLNFKIDRGQVKMSARILVADDNRLNLRLLTNILESQGYEVLPADDGLEVLKIAKLQKPDIILLDIIMPGMDGFEACKYLKRDQDLKDIPIIMVSAKTEGINIKMALELGAFDYIKKPLDEGEVIARVQAALRLKGYHDKLKEMAMKDGLTGLYNHTLLMELFQKEVSKLERKYSSICFAMIDIDYFKKINDTYGHIVGDMVLKEFSNILLHSVRIGDIVGRYGGEEFGIILPEIYYKDAYHLCERIRRNIENHKFDADDKIISITISVGVSFKGPIDSLTPIDMIRIADSALYDAKENGRNRVEMRLPNGYNHRNTYLPSI